MSEETIQSYLKNSSLFAQLLKEQLYVIQQQMEQVIFPAGTTFIEQDTPADSVYFIVHGGVRIFRLNEDGVEVPMSLAGPGDIVGEMAMIDESPRSASVQTLQETAALMLRKQDFQKILQQYPDIAISLLHELSQKLRRNTEHIEMLSSQNLLERTWVTLETLCKLFPNREIRLSQEELATIVGATRARISEVLNQLQAEGKISLSHRSIHVL